MLCIGEGRQPGISGSPTILSAAPEAAIGGELVLVGIGDQLRIDLKARRIDMPVDADELQRRKGEVADLEPRLEPAVKYQRVVQTKGLPRDSH